MLTMPKYVAKTRTNKWERETKSKFWEWYKHLQKRTAICI